MISNGTIAVYVGMIFLGLILPIGVSAVWVIKTKQPITTILIGAGIFFAFAIVLESIPKLLLFQTNNPIGKFVMENTFLYMSIAALLAGIFEETGRLVAIKFLLKKETKKETAITYGIGHGGFEVMYLLVIGGINNLIYAFMINAGQFDMVVEQLKIVAPDQVEAFAQLPESLAAVGVSTLLLSVAERISAMMIHIACSVIMFRAVRCKGKMWMFGLAILLHASVDMFAALYQCGFITNLIVFEICLMIWAIIFLTITLRSVYRKLESV